MLLGAKHPISSTGKGLNILYLVMLSGRGVENLRQVSEISKHKGQRPAQQQKKEKKRTNLLRRVELSPSTYKPNVLTDLATRSDLLQLLRFDMPNGGRKG